MPSAGHLIEEVPLLDLVWIMEVIRHGILIFLLGTHAMPVIPRGGVSPTGAIPSMVCGALEEHGRGAAPPLNLNTLPLLRALRLPGL